MYVKCYLDVLLDAGLNSEVMCIENRLQLAKEGAFSGPPALKVANL